MRKDNVICLVNYALAGDFFIRLAKSDPSRSYTIVTSALSIYAKSRLAGVPVKLITVFSEKNSYQVRVDEYSCIEYHLDLMSKAQLDSLASRLFAFCRKTNGTFSAPDPVYLLVWNGQSVLGEVARALKRNRPDLFRTAFLEISNIPGKLFVNDEGVNKSSSLFHSPDLVLEYAHDGFDYSEWRKEFIKKKMAPVGPDELPQKSLSTAINIYQVFDVLGFLITGYRTFAWSSVGRRINYLLDKYYFKPSKLSSLDGPKFSGGYVFFPMQVKNDTQILINSKVDNVKALQLKLDTTSDFYAVKPHPADVDDSYLREFAAKNKERLEIVAGNTYKLILGADKVVVINSTVGFEAMVMGKQVEFMGSSFYEGFTDRHILLM